MALKVVQLTSPETQPNFYGFSPRAQARADCLGAHRYAGPPRSSKGLDRDRAVDETGGQIAVFGRLGSRPFNRTEMEQLFLNSLGKLYLVERQARHERLARAGAGRAAELIPFPGEGRGPVRKTIHARQRPVDALRRIWTPAFAGEQGKI